MLRVGLTGGIASGKSQVAHGFSEAGAFVLDLDRVAHDVMAPGAATYAAVVAAFGDGILAPDGAIDRRKLGPRVFGDPAERALLDSLVHPAVRDEEQLRLAGAEAAGAALALSEAALLVESGGHLRYDRLVVAWCPPEEQRRRLAARDGLPGAAVEARLDAQMPAGEKKAFAHLVVSTEGGLDETATRTRAAVADLVSLAARPPSPVAVDEARAAVLRERVPAPGPGGTFGARFEEWLRSTPGLELKPLAALLDPPPRGPWYRSAEGRAAESPMALAVPLARHCLALRGDDPPYLASAAASLARLTQTRPAAIATAVLATLVVAELLQAARDAALVAERHRDAAERWGGAAPDARHVLATFG